MSKTIIVLGYGSGISHAVAHAFGKQGFQVALVSRTREKIDGGAAALRDEGIAARGFVCDLADADAVRALVRDVRAALGPITVVHHNAYAPCFGDLLTADVGDLRRIFDVAVVGLVAAVQAAHADLVAARGAVLVTGGGFAFYDDNVDRMVVQFQSGGLAMSKAAQHKLVGVLHQRLAADGVYVGEVVVTGIVKGTAFDAAGYGTIEASTVAARFWDLYSSRAQAVAVV